MIRRCRVHGSGPPGLKPARTLVLPASWPGHPSHLGRSRVTRRNCQLLILFPRTHPSLRLTLLLLAAFSSHSIADAAVDCHYCWHKSCPARPAPPLPHVNTASTKDSQRQRDSGHSPLHSAVRRSFRILVRSGGGLDIIGRTLQLVHHDLSSLPGPAPAIHACAVALDAASRQPTRLVAEINTRLPNTI